MSLALHALRAYAFHGGKSRGASGQPAFLKKEYFF